MASYSPGATGRWLAFAGVVLTFVAAAGCRSGVALDRAPDADISAESRRLADGLITALREAGWADLVDFARRVDGVAQPIAALPNVEAALIELGADGHVAGAAYVVLDRDRPEGLSIAVDPQTLAATGVRFTQWRTARWDDAARWSSGPDPVDELSGGPGDPEFMLPYPASLLKLMVAWSTLRLVDAGRLALDDLHAYRQVDGRGCAPHGEVKTVAERLDAMITVSSNGATCALLQLLEDLGELDAANAHFAALGLGTFRMIPGQRDVGATWLDPPARMTMSALDTARLLLLLSGSERVGWRAPDGTRVTPDVLSAASRAFFRRLLAEQGLHEVLSTSLRCGSPLTAPGIPAAVPSRFVDPDTGHGVLDGEDYGHDVRPCNAAAEVEFAHKTGLVSVAGGDAGIVRALPGGDGRWYVVALKASVGSRFGDAAWARREPGLCEDPAQVCYSRAFARTGAAIDALLQTRPASPRRDRSPPGAGRGTG